MNKNVREVLTRYRDIINELRKLGVIRTGKVVSDYGEYVVCEKLGLKLTENVSNKGYDAVGKDGLKYEIKTRKATAWNKPTVFPIKKEQLETADFLIYIEFDDNWEVVRLLKIPCSEVKGNVHNRVVITKELTKKYGIKQRNLRV